jgi:hypothetical protein
MEVGILGLAGSGKTQDPDFHVVSHEARHEPDEAGPTRRRDTIAEPAAGITRASTRTTSRAAALISRGARMVRHAARRIPPRAEIDARNFQT